MQSRERLSFIVSHSSTIILNRKNFYRALKMILRSGQVHSEVLAKTGNVLVKLFLVPRSLKQRPQAKVRGNIDGVIWLLIQSQMSLVNDSCNCFDIKSNNAKIKTQLA